MKRTDETTELVVKQAFEESPGELSSRNPMVLSCGGIYIPNRRSALKKPLWQILNLPDENHPTKVVSSNIPRNPLMEILEKESMN